MKLTNYFLLIFAVLLIIPAMSHNDLIKKGKKTILSGDQQLIAGWKSDFVSLIKDNILIELLIKAEKEKNGIEHLCLMYALMNGCQGYVIKELMNGIQLNVNWSFQGFGLLHAACSKNNVEMAEEFIEQGADIYAQDDTGRRPIDYAARKGNIEVLQLLMQSDPKLITIPIKVVDDKNEMREKHTLDYAVEKARISTVHFLLKHPYAAYKPEVIARNKQQAHKKMHSTSDKQKKIAYQCILDELKLIEQRKH